MKFLYQSLIVASCLISTSAFSQILSPDHEIGLYQNDKHTAFIRDSEMLSPKSAEFLDKHTLAINALEAGKTLIYDTETWQKEPSINHTFNQPEFQKLDNFPYPVFTRPFMGKPVEITHNQDKIWIPYYRYSWDTQSEHGSAIAQIDMKTRQIEKLIPAGNIPKMVTLSHNEQFLASTNWGDNTVIVYDLKNSEVTGQRYFTIDKKLNTEHITGDRDSHCGFCLRGTVFSPDDHYLLVSRMGGGGIALINLATNQYEGTARGVPLTPRHLVLKGDMLYISTCYSKQIARINVHTFIEHYKSIKLSDWQVLNMGSAVRTLSVSADGKYTYATLNDTSEVAVVDNENFKIIEKHKVASFPVGLTVSPDDQYIVVTSQGKTGRGGGNHIDIFKRNFP